MINKIKEILEQTYAYNVENDKVAQQLLDLLSKKSNSFNITESAQEKLDYILGSSVAKEFPKVKPTMEWVGAILDFFEMVGID